MLCSTLVTNTFVMDLHFKKDTLSEKLSHLWVATLCDARHDRMILDKLKSSLTELETFQIVPYSSLLVKDKFLVALLKYDV